MHGHSGPDKGDRVSRTRGENPAATDREDLTGSVDHRCATPRRPQVGEAGDVRSRRDKCCGLIGVAGLEHGGAGHRAKARDVLQTHPRRAGLAYRQPRVRAAQPYRGPADGGHPGELERAGCEGREGRRERGEAAGRESHGRRKHLLLGDEHLEIAVGMRHGEQFGVGGVVGLRVQHDDVVAGITKGDKSLTIGEPGGHDRAGFVARQRRSPDPPRDLGHRAGRRGHDPRVRGVPEQRECGVGVGQRTAVITVRAGDGSQAVALLRTREYRHRAAVGRQRLTKRLVKRCQIMTVDLDGPPAERLGAPCIHRSVAVDHGRAALAQPVGVDDDDEVVKPVVSGVLERLPYRALGQLAVPAQDEHPRRARLKAGQRQRQSDACGDTLAQRAGRDVHPGQDRPRVPLQAATGLAVGQQLVVVYRPHRLQPGVEQRGRVALRQDEPVVARVGGIGDVVPKTGAEHGHHVRGRRAGGRMPGTGAGGGTDEIDTQLTGELGQVGQNLDGGHCTPPLLGAPVSGSPKVASGTRTVISRSATSRSMSSLKLSIAELRR